MNANLHTPNGPTPDGCYNQPVNTIGGTSRPAQIVTTASIAALYLELERSGLTVTANFFRSYIAGLEGRLAEALRLLELYQADGKGE
jgi:hypothetical protein